MGNGNGAFYAGPTTIGGNISAINEDCAHSSGNSDDGYHDGIGYDLSRSSEIFNGTTVQPNALQALACIRF